MNYATSVMFPVCTLCPWGSKVYGYISVIFFLIYAKGNNFWDFMVASLDEALLKRGSTLKGKNLLLEEQILSFKSWPHWEGKEAKNENGRVVSPEIVPIHP